MQVTTEHCEEYKNLAELSKRRAAIAREAHKAGPRKNDSPLSRQADYIDSEIENAVLTMLQMTGVGPWSLHNTDEKGNENVQEQKKVSNC